MSELIDAWISHCATCNENSQSPFDSFSAGFTARQTANLDELLAACDALLEWDFVRGFRLPYKVRDPIIAAIASVKDSCGAHIGSQAAKDVIAERIRQQTVEGWTPEHDDQHKNGEMPLAAGLYAISAGFATKYLEGETETCPVPDGWPWAPEWWKPSNARRDLVKAAALILAEIDRLDRSSCGAQAETAKNEGGSA